MDNKENTNEIVEKEKKPRTRKTASSETKTTTAKKTSTKTTTKKTTKKTTTSKSKEAVKEVEISAGDRDCYCYFSMKLTNDFHDADIISLAMVSSDGDTLYLFNNTCDTNKCDKETYKARFATCIKPEEPHLVGHTWAASCDKMQMLGIISKWLDEHYTSKGKFIQFCGDKIRYEFMFLKELFIRDSNSFIENQMGISEYCVDLNAELSHYLSVTSPDNTNENFVPMYEAGNIDRTATYNNVINSLPNEIKITDVSILQMLQWANKTEEDALVSAVLTRFIHQDIWGMH